MVARASHKLVLEDLNDLQQRILLNPVESTPEGPPDPFVLRAASLIISLRCSDGKGNREYHLSDQTAAIPISLPEVLGVFPVVAP